MVKAWYRVNGTAVSGTISGQVSLCRAAKLTYVYVYACEDVRVWELRLQLSELRPRKMEQPGGNTSEEPTVKVVQQMLDR